jgi:hypothetical protein
VPTNAKPGPSSDTVRGAHTRREADSVKIRHEMENSRRAGLEFSSLGHCGDHVKHWFRRTVLSRSWLTFFVMGLAFFVFGVGTYNIFMLLRPISTSSHITAGGG